MERQRRIPIRIKLVISLGLFLVVVLLLLGGISMRLFSFDMAASLERRAEVTVKNLAYAVSDHLAKGDSEHLTPLLLAANNTDPDVVFAMVSDPTGKTIATSDPRQRESDRQSLGIDSYVRRESSRPQEFEVLVPLKVNGAQAGVLRLGYSTRSISQAEGTAASYILIGGAVSLLAGFLIFGGVIHNTVLLPIERVTEQAERIAQGDLRAMVYSRNNDELGDLQECMESMTEYLREVAATTERIAIGDLRVNIIPRSEHDVFGAAQLKMVQSWRTILLQLGEGAQSLSSAAMQMVDTSRSQGSSILEQASAIQEILATVEEIRATVKQANEMAGSVVEISDISLDESKAGQQAMETSVDAMHKIREQVEAIADNILDLSDKTVQIGEITASVNDIAEQSNLLAVNAAIEAARAGEAGKSFGVVATEVKNLAAQSKQATAQVRSILGEIQRAATSTVMVTEEGAKRADSGVEQVKRIGENFERLYNVILDSATAAKQIAAVTEHQVAGIEQITQAMREISRASDRSVVAAREQENTAQTLSSLASQLHSIVSRYRLSDEGPSPK